MSGATIDQITDIALSFMASNALMTAIELDVFSVIGDRPQTSDLIARSVGVDEEDQTFVNFLDALVALRILEREGDAEDALYANTPSGSEFLNRTSDHFIGGGLLTRHQLSEGNWNIYAEDLRAGDYREKAAGRFEEMMFELNQNSAQLLNWYQGLASYEAEDYRSLAKIFDFSAYTSLLDISGGIARLPIEFGRHHPHLHFIVFDRPKVAALARSYIEARQLQFRVDAMSGNFLEDRLPIADVAVLSHILRKLSRADKSKALQKAFDAVPEDGAVIVMDVMHDDHRRQKWYPLLLSVQLQLEFGQGGCMTVAEQEQLAREVGFSRFEYHQISDNVVASFMYK